MKYLAILVLSFLCLSKSLVLAQINGVDILSQSYSVSGDYSYAWNGDGIPLQGSGPFGGSSNDGTPLNVGYSVPAPAAVLFPQNYFGTQIPSAHYVNYTIDTFAFQFSGFATGTGQALTSSDGNVYSCSTDAAGNTSSAQANWLFQPTSANEQITLNFGQSGGYITDQTLSVSLTDVTGNNILFNYSGDGEEYYTLSPQKPPLYFSLNSSDQYQLSVSSQSDIWDNDNLSQQFSASIEPKPAPEPSTFCLFPLAIAIFIASRKHFQLVKARTNRF